MTALMYAAENNHVEVIKYLVEKGANINVKDLVSSGFANYFTKLIIF